MVALVPFAIGIANQGFSLFAKGAARRAENEAAQAQYDYGVRKAYSDFEQVATQQNNEYRASVQRWLQDMTYTAGLRQFEAQKRANNAEMGQRLYAESFKAFERDGGALQRRFVEDDAVMGLQWQQAQLQSLRAKSSFNAAAVGRQGASIDRLASEFTAQLAESMRNFAVQRQWNSNAYVESARSLELNTLGRLNQWAPYNEQPYQNPMMPIAPITPKVTLPTPPKSSGGLGALDYLGAAMGVYQTYTDLMPKGRSSF